ncbi:MAG: 2-oxo acid dehydrogenase subunit E2 [Actinomycetota bacterium]|nr:2-oxo acid dehydrogenase subunit E2 [Actinomycetota bacterium]
MADRIFKLPDVGEGIAEAEIVEWLVAPGDVVEVDQPLVEVMTDKATVELPSPYPGRIVAVTGEPGDLVSVGAELARFSADLLSDGGDHGIAAHSEPSPSGVTHTAPPSSEPATTGRSEPSDPIAPAVQAHDGPELEPVRSDVAPTPAAIPAVAPTHRPVASPAVRRRANEAGIKLGYVVGSGPAGRIEHTDLDSYLEQVRAGGPVRAATNDVVTTTKVIGLRRKIAEQMSLAKSRIPHIAYVEEVDLTELELLRSNLNENRRPDQPKLTVLPFLLRAIVRAGAAVPVVNATFDDEAGVVHQHSAFHVGVAAQTPNGLVVPVVRHAEGRDVWELAAEINRLASEARSGSIHRGDLTGSTITVSSLGAMGGLVTTPVINHPEVAIVGVNKLQVRPAWNGSTFVPRRLLNLSSSFDHRIVDGWDAAVFVQEIKKHLELPALLFMEVRP